MGYGFEVGGVGVDVGYMFGEYIDSTPDATFDETYLGCFWRPRRFICIR